ncbi:hypothetical protein [Pseudomonas sp. CGJS7]|uniref:hypothetical protein n=1 Tax=Pseudomonas sp. CGJS7 TaxID=3109348 RepID=UPI003008C407
MKITLLAGAIALASLPAMAKDKLIPLAAADAAALKDKTVAVTFHEAADFTAMTAGKATLGLFGGLAMIKTGNDLVSENGIADPAILLRQQLGDALRQTYGAQIRPVDAAATKAKKPKEIAAVHPETDYVLDVRSGGWMYAYFPTDWNSYQVVYSVQVQLVAKDGRQVSNAACTANTKANTNPPSREQLIANGAQLLKDYTAALGWNCLQILATNQFMVPLEKFAGVPQPYAGLIASFTPQGQGSVKVANGGTATSTAKGPVITAPIADAHVVATAPIEVGEATEVAVAAPASAAAPAPAPLSVEAPVAPVAQAVATAPIVSAAAVAPVAPVASMVPAVKTEVPVPTPVKSVGDR